jgi:hypothetical protein
MTTSEQMFNVVASCPNGYKHILIMVAVTKKALVECQMTAAQRLDLLQKMNALTDAYITPAAVATVEPACDTFMAILDEARKLDDPSDPGGMASFKMLTSRDVFAHLRRLNPSLDAAIAFCRQW